MIKINKIKMKNTWPKLRVNMEDKVCNIQMIEKMAKREKMEYGIILDLDSTLIYTFDQDEASELEKIGIWTKVEYVDIRRRLYKIVVDDVMTSTRGIGEQIELWGIMRPYLMSFLKFCFEHFLFVAIWSAGRRKYVEACVDILFCGIQRPHVIYTYDDCIKHDLKKGKTVLVKPIQKMITAIPKLDKYLNLDNCLILDDTEYTFSHTNKDNGILIPQFRPNILSLSEHQICQNLRYNDTALLSCINYFKSQPHIPNWRLTDKSQIFSN